MESRAGKRTFFAKKRREFISRIENSKRPLWQFVAFFLAALALRMAIEPLSTKEVYAPLTPIHYASFYVSVALSLILVLSIFAKTAPKKVAKIVLPFFAVIIIPPVIDLIMTAGRGLPLAYIDPRTNPLLSFITLGGSPYEGVTFGIKVEIIVVLVLCLYYLTIKGVGALRAIAGTFLAYSVIFFHLGASFIFVLIFLPLPFFRLELLNPLMIAYSLAMILVESVLLLFISDRKLFRAGL